MLSEVPLQTVKIVFFRDLERLSAWSAWMFSTDTKITVSQSVIVTGLEGCDLFSEGSLPKRAPNH